jgi:hypothetical protein
MYGGRPIGINGIMMNLVQLEVNIFGWRGRPIWTWSNGKPY